MQSKIKKIVTFFTQAAILLFLGFLVSQSVGLGAAGFDTEAILGQFNFYIVSIGFMLGLAFLFIVNFVIRKGDEKYGDSLGFASPGEKPAIPFFKRFSSIQILLLSLIGFGIFGLIAFTTGQNTFTGVMGIEQQFSPTSQLLFSSLLIPISENLGAAFLIGILLFGLGMLARKIKMSSPTFSILAIFTIPLLIGAYGVINHLLRYSSSDLALIIVFFFWYIGGILTILTGTFIPFWVMHLVNNLFFDMQRLFDSDVVVIYTIGVLVLISIAYFIIYRKRIFGKSPDG